MDFSQALQAYMDVGFLGLCGVLICVMFYLFVKRSHQKEDEKDDNSKSKDKFIQDGFKSMIDLMTERFDKLDERQHTQQEQILENNKILLNAIISRSNKPRSITRRKY